MDKETKRLIESFRAEINYMKPSEWAEKHRVLSKGPFPGNFSFKRAPYTREMVDSIMPDVEARIIAIMKGSQIGFTVSGLVTILGWILAQNPADTLFMTETDEKIRKAMDGPIQDMISSSGLSDLIGKSDSRTRKGGSSGDTLKGKVFQGNYNLITHSGQAIRRLSSDSVQYALCDELDRYMQFDAYAGDPVDLVLQRMKAYQYEYKLFAVSTPELEHTSIIKPLYLKGDRRAYYMPCKHCGEYIKIEFQAKSKEGDKAGIYYKRKGSKSVDKKSVGYVCYKCANFFTESHKHDVLGDDVCIWQPTATPIDSIYRSYHISALWATKGFYDWGTVAQKWCEINPVNGAIDQERLKTFVNQDLGETYEKKAKSVEVKHLAKNTRPYKINTIPSELSKDDGNGDIILLTCAVDINGIIKEDDPSQDDIRIDYEVKAYSENADDYGVYVPSYSIDHGSFGTFERASDKRKREKQGANISEEEKTRVKWTCRNGYPNCVWDEFEKQIMNKVYEREDGKKMKIMIYLIDTGHFTIHANQFIAKHKLCYGVKGAEADKFTNATNKRDIYYTKSAKQSKLYHVEGDKIKDILAEKMVLKWVENVGMIQPFGFMNFPEPEDGKYTMKSFFCEYEGEKRKEKTNELGKTIGYIWTKKQTTSRNHFWDCNVYNDAGQKIMTEILCKLAGVDVKWENMCKLLKR